MRGSGAAEQLGTPYWFPDWRGQTCVIVASGPSAAEQPIEQARGRARVIAINTSFRLCGWADALYACDGRWWEETPGAQAFKGLKITQDERAAERFGLLKVSVDTARHTISDEPGVLGAGGNSGFQALNLAVQFGCRRVLLVGYDMRVDRGLHWHGAHGSGLNNPQERAVNEWRERLDAIAPDLAARGVEVLNCSTISTLTAYRKVPLADVV